MGGFNVFMLIIEKFLLLDRCLGIFFFGWGRKVIFLSIFLVGNVLEIKIWWLIFINFSVVGFKGFI